MTKEDIIKPENLVYKKPTLMNDNPMHSGMQPRCGTQADSRSNRRNGHGRQSSRYLPRGMCRVHL